MSPPSTYEIDVVGHLGDHWSDRLAGAAIARRPGGTSRITVTVADQAQLHGVLAGLRDLNVDLVALRRAETYRRTSHSDRSSA